MADGWVDEAYERRRDRAGELRTKVQNLEKIVKRQREEIDFLKEALQACEGNLNDVVRVAYEREAKANG